MSAHSRVRRTGCLLHFRLPWCEESSVLDVPFETPHLSLQMPLVPHECALQHVTPSTILTMECEFDGLIVILDSGSPTFRSMRRSYCVKGALQGVAHAGVVGQQQPRHPMRRRYVRRVPRDAHLRGLGVHG